MLTFYRLIVTDFDKFDIHLLYSHVPGWEMNTVLKDYVSKDTILHYINYHVAKRRDYFYKIFPRLSDECSLRKLTRRELIRILFVLLDVDSKFNLSLKDFAKGFYIDFGFNRDSYVRCIVNLK